MLSSYPSHLEVAEDSESRERDELVQNNQEAAEFGPWGMCFELIFQPEEVTTILFLFVFQRAEFPWTVVGQGVPGLLRVAATGAGGF